MAGAAGFARYAFPFLLPDMREALSSTYGHMGLLVTINNIGYVISSLLGGIISARYGARRVIFLSMFSAGFFTFATGLSPGVEVALVLQFMVGLSAGGAIVPAVGLVAGWFEPRKRGIATGVMVGGFPLSMVASALFLPLVLTNLGPDAWRYGWMLLGGLVILLGLVDLATVHEPPVSAVPSGNGGSRGAAGAAPLRWGLVYKNPRMWHMATINLCIGFAAGVFSTFLVAYLIAERGLTAPEAAQAFGLVGLMGAASGILWGYISDLMGRKFGLAACYFAFSLALAILTFVPWPTVPYLAAVLGGLTMTGGMAVSVALLGDALGPRLAAPAFGFISLFFNLGQVISPSLAGAIIDATGSFASSLAAATGFGFLAATLCIFIRLRASGADQSSVPMKRATDAL